jgi:hypothetical protein
MAAPRHARVVSEMLSDGSEVFDVIVTQAGYVAKFHAADERGAEEFARSINEGRLWIADDGVAKA